jgi:hypothetical protein
VAHRSPAGAILPAVTLFEAQDAAAAWRRDLRRLRRGGRRPRWPVVVGILLAVVSGAAFFFTTQPSNPLSIGGDYQLSPELSAVADGLAFTEAGRALFVDTQPQLLTDDPFRRFCASTPDGTGADGRLATVGCFVPGFDGPGRIGVFQPSDPRLGEQVSTTTAHEFLHAAYDRLSAAERGPLDALLAARWAQLPADDPLQERLASSVGGYEPNRGTEQFAFLGSEVGDLGPELEAYYAPYFVDRQVVVAHAVGELGVWNALLADYQAAADALSIAEQAVAAAEQQLLVDRMQLETDRSAYTVAADAYNALTPESRAASRALDDDGVARPWGDVLADRLASIQARDAEYPARQAQLDADRAATQAQRADLERRSRDVEALESATVPRAG